jgi:ABC-2 type transport system permease protein
MQGSFLLLAFISAIFLIGALSLGILISTVAGTQLVASQMAIVITFLPSFLLSGFISAIANMPVAIQYLSALVPARYFVTVLKGIYLKGVGLEVLYPEVLLLTLFGMGVFLLANRKFVKKLSA